MREGILQYVLLISLALIWGSSFILMKVGLIVLSPIQLALIRIGFSGLIFAPFALRHLPKIPRSDVKYLPLAGLLGSALPAILFATAQTKLDSNIAGILNGLTPVFTIIVGLIFVGLTVSKKQILGVLVGFVGAATIIMSRPTDLNFYGQMGYALMVVVATAMYGANINLIKTKLSHNNAFRISTTPLFFVGIPALISLPFIQWDNIQLHSQIQLFQSVGATITLSLFGTAISLILFNRLVQISGTVFSSSVTYLIPLVAMCIGAIDGEVIKFGQIVGVLCILGGVYLINHKASKGVKAS